MHTISVGIFYVDFVPRVLVNGAGARMLDQPRRFLVCAYTDHVWARPYDLGIVSSLCLLFDLNSVGKAIDAVAVRNMSQPHGLAPDEKS